MYSADRNEIVSLTRTTEPRCMALRTAGKAYPDDLRSCDGPANGSVANLRGVYQWQQRDAPRRAALGGLLPAGPHRSPASGSAASWAATLPFDAVLIT